MVDLKIDENGDFVIGPNGDFATVSGDEQIIQTAIFILKTYIGDCGLNPTLGLSLEDFIGGDNDSTTRTLIEQRVADALSKDRVLPNPKVDCVSLSDSEIFILIQFPSTEDTTKKIQLSSSLDLKTGEVFSRFNYNVA